jgi:polyisoprenoid-binding protein YceI
VKSGLVRLGATRGAGEIIFDLTSFQADTPRARRYIGLQGDTSASTQQKVTANMLGSDVLDTARYPTATFTITSAIPLRQSHDVTTTQYTLDGKFTLHGVTRPLRVVADAEPNGPRVRLRGSFPIRQTEFGIRPYSTGLGAIGVADELVVHGDIWIAADQVRR